VDIADRGPVLDFPRGIGPALGPVAHRVQDIEQRLALVGQPIIMAQRPFAVHATLGDPFRNEHLEPRRYQLRSQPCVRRDQFEAPTPEQQLAQNQQHRAIAEKLGRPADGT